MAEGYVSGRYEDTPGNETNSPTPSTKRIYIPALSFNPSLNPAHLQRDDEIRNVDEPLMVLPERYAPEWSLETRNYPDTWGFLLKLILGAPTTTQGDGSAVLDPDGNAIPASAYRHVWTAPFGPTGSEPLTAHWQVAYEDQSVWFDINGAALRTLAITTPETGGGRLAASGPALFMDRVSDPSLSPAYESLAIPPFFRSHLTIPDWLSGSAARFEDFSVNIENPCEPYASLGIASKFPDVMEKTDAPITFTGSAPMRQLDPDDYDALEAATGFAATAKWESTANVTGSYPYSAWIEFDNCQLMTGGPEALENRRRIGATFDFKATYDGAGASTTVTLVNGTADYS